MKTGTLNDVIALAGVFPTREQGLVWFTIVNRSPYWQETRAEQDKFLQQLVNRWGSTISPRAITPKINGDRLGLGDSKRNHFFSIN